MGLSLTQLTFLTLFKWRTIEFINKCPLYPQTKYETACNLNLNSKYDFVIVGGGSAGTVVANRLSENPNWKILLIEAGGYPWNLTEPPALYSFMQRTELEWQFQTEPGQNCKGLENGRCNFPQGKVLGGGSVINGMLSFKGVDRDYNNWAKLGNPSWDWKSMQPYFEKIYTRMKMSRRTKIFPPFSYIEESLKDPELKQDPNSLWLGFGYLNTTIFENQRFNAAKGYIASVRNRNNLCILTNSQVVKILFDEKNKMEIPKAIGVQLMDGKTIFVKKEVIISAGAINTPKLLMLSGIGPKEHLKTLKIPLVKDLPVGENFQDHLMFFGQYIQIPGSPIVVNMREELYNFCEHQSGVLSTTIDYSGFINTLQNSKYPDIQYHILMQTKSSSFFDYSTLLAYQNYGFNMESLRSLRTFTDTSTVILMGSTLLNPKSKGSIRLKSIDPNDPPLIDPNYMSDKNDEDINTMLRGIEFVNKMITKKPFVDLNATIVNFYIPNCKDLQFNSREYWICNLRNFGSTVYHPAGTCKMGPSGDKDAVVSPELKVHGVDGLRVIDNSIMPELVSGNTMLPAFAIAEKGSDLIKQDLRT